MAREPGEPPCPMLESTDVQLGQSATLLRGGSATLVHAHGSSQGAQLATVVLYTSIDPAEFPAAVAAGRRAPIEAIVSFGQGACNASQPAPLRVDFRTGVQFTLPCSFVDVRAVFAATDPATPARVQVGAAVTWGARSNRDPTVSLEPVALAAAGAAGDTVVVPVPPYAYAYQTQFPPGAAPGAVLVLELGGPAVTDLIYASTDGAVAGGVVARTSDGLRLHGSTRFLAFVNTSPAPQAPRPVFALAA